MPCRHFKSYRTIPYFELKPPSLKHMFTRICRINIISFQTKDLQVGEADHSPIFFRVVKSKDVMLLNSSGYTLAL